MDKPIYLGFAVLELSKVHMYEIYYVKLQPYFRQEFVQLPYIDTDAFVLSVNRNDLIKNLKNSEGIFEFSDLDKSHEIFINKNKKFVGKFKLETPKKIWIDDFVCLRSKIYSFKCGDGRKKNKKYL